MYHLQTQNDPDETWNDLKTCKPVLRYLNLKIILANGMTLDGYDDNLNLVSSRTEDVNPISPAPEK